MIIDLYDMLLYFLIGLGVGCAVVGALAMAIILYLHYTFKGKG